LRDGPRASNRDGGPQAGSVVVAGNLPWKDGKYSLYCAVIVKKVDEKTRAKTSLNDLLRTPD
jgi:2,3,4,5-tetrahydropyridine-2-carboxylate N-succinyltransferase